MRNYTATSLRAFMACTGVCIFIYRQRERERERTQVQQLKSGKEKGDSVSHHRSEVQN